MKKTVMKRTISRKGYSMRKSILTLIIMVVLGLVVPAYAAYYVAGEFNGWDPGANVMVDNGDGTYSFTITGQGANQRQHPLA